MKTIIILGLLQVCLYQAMAVFSPADWALEIKHNDPEADNDFINATEIVKLDLLPFLRAVMSSEEIGLVPNFSPFGEFRGISKFSVPHSSRNFDWGIGEKW